MDAVILDIVILWYWAFAVAVTVGSAQDQSAQLPHNRNKELICKSYCRYKVSPKLYTYEEACSQRPVIDIVIPYVGIRDHVRVSLHLSNGKLVS